MKDFYDDFSYILSFLVMVFIINAIAGEKVVKGFLALCIAGMVIFNAGAITDILKKAFS